MQLTLTKKNKKEFLASYKKTVTSEIERSNSYLQFNFMEIINGLIDFTIDKLEEYKFIYCDIEKNYKLFEDIIKGGNKFLPPGVEINRNDKTEKLKNCYEWLKQELEASEYQDILNEISWSLLSGMEFLYYNPLRIENNVIDRKLLINKTSLDFINSKKNYLLKIYNDIEKYFSNFHRVEWISINQNSGKVKLILTLRKHLTIYENNIYYDNNLQKNITSISWKTTDFEIPYNLNSMESIESDDYYSITMFHKRKINYQIRIEKNENTINYLQTMYNGMQ